MKLHYVLLLSFVSLIGWRATASAHGVKLKYRTTQAVEIQAAYDGGQPMANAQITVYAPDDPSSAWLTGTTDATGKFTFTPEANQIGNWDVKVRQAGHGEIVTIELGAAELNTSSMTSVQTQAFFTESSYTPLQKLIMAATGIWGCVGTALFFYRRKIES